MTLLFSRLTGNRAREGKKKTKNHTRYIFRMNPRSKPNETRLRAKRLFVFFFFKKYTRLLLSRKFRGEEET